MNHEQLLIDEFLLRHPVKAIEAIDELAPEGIALLLESLSPDQCLVVFSRLVPYKAGKILEHVLHENAIMLVELMPILTAESILRVCEKPVRDRILKGMTPEKGKYLKRALSFKKDQVGAHLQSDVFTLQEGMKVEKAMLLIKSGGAVVKPHVFVINDHKMLTGYLEVTELIQSPHNLKVRSLMKHVPQVVYAVMSAQDLLNNWDHTFADLPVVKVSGEFLGTVSWGALAELNASKPVHDHSALKAGNALGELYAIGLTSLLGRVEANLKS